MSRHAGNDSRCARHRPSRRHCRRSVANLTRRDGSEFLALAHQVPVHTQVDTLPLAEANTALARLRNGTVQGAIVLTIN